jgi:FkbM family methyltransferase
MLEVKHYNGDYDLSILREVPREYAGVVDRFADAIVLDIGAHVGCFSVLALNSGAKKVISIEPGKLSVRYLRKNMREAGNRSEVLHAGITHDPNIRRITLRYLQHGQSMAAAKTVQDRSRKDWRGVPYVYETVDALHFATALKKYEPRVLKMDCEGPEYDCIESIDEMPLCVDTFIAEWHKTAGKTVLRYLACTKKLKSWGFKPEKQPNLVLKRDAAGKVIGGNQFFIRPIAWRR